MTTQQSNNINESNSYFIKFLTSNNLKRTGIDFSSKSGIYHFSSQDKNERGFRKQNLSTAYAGFIDGYFGNQNKSKIGFGQLDEQSKGKSHTIKELVEHEFKIKAVLSGSDSISNFTEVPIQKSEIALGVVQEKLYSAEYKLGRSANTLNENK